MGFRAQRLRRGEILVGPAALVLLSDLFVLPWYTTGRVMPVSMSGWQSVSVLRWPVLVTAMSGLALTWFQGTRRAPALPASLSVMTAALGLVTSVALVVRLLVGAPALLGHTHGSAGLTIGLLAALAVTAAAVLSLRDEDPPDPQRNAAIPIVPLPK